MNNEGLHKKLQEMFALYHFPAHDYKHVLRVSRLARQIAQAEGYDEKEAEIAGLLHDVGRTVKDSTKPHAHEGVPIAKALLDEYTDFSQDARDRILKAIELHSDKFTTGHLNNILQDADKLDGMGAIGISRSYMSHHDREDYDPENIIPSAGIYGAFKNVHELIALELEWYSMLVTDKAREIGRPRYEYMKRFLEEFKKEVEESS